MIQQTVLSCIQSKATHRFSNFYAGCNQDIVHCLQEFLTTSTEPYMYLAGGPGSGRTHLLHALIHQAHELSYPSVYCPFDSYERYEPSLLDDIEASELICIDDINRIAGNKAWEIAAFDAFNRIREQSRRLVVVGNVLPSQLPLQLLDLRSRLSSGLCFFLQPLSDIEKQGALQKTAEDRGFTLPDSVAKYLMTHYGRESRELFAILARLDDASLEAKRKLTIPFVKQVLDSVMTRQVS